VIAYEQENAIGGWRICMILGVIGSVTKDRIVIEKNKKNSFLLKHLNHKNIRSYPTWTDKTTVYENRYPSDSHDICERTIIERASDFSMTHEFLHNLSSCAAIHLGPLAPDEFSHDTYAKLLKEHLLQQRAKGEEVFVTDNEGQHYFIFIGTIFIGTILRR
jgi:hypothetical protein